MNKNTKINMTYNNYISMSTNPTKEYLMISELIDNSIGSFEAKNGEDFKKWPRGEIVNVVVDIFTNTKAKIKSKIHDKTVVAGSYIEVQDNAYGMDADILFESIKIDNKKIVDGSNKNVHGRGMKQAAFYFGMGLNIKTNDGNDSNELKIDLEKIEDLSSDFERKVSKCDKKERGTSIKIFNIYYSKIPTNNIINEIIETLKTRYWKYIESGRLVVEVKTDIFGLEKRIINNEMDKPLYLNVDTVDNFLEGKEREKALREINKLIDDQKMSPSQNSRSGELTNPYKELIKKNIKNMFISGQEYKWEYNDVSFGFMDETIKLNLSFWKNGNKKNFGPYRGIYIYEGGRAIKHGPNNGAYLEWFKNNSHSSGSTDNKFFGEIDITNIDEITAVNDKSNIEVPKDIKDEMDDFIFWNWQIFDKVENFIRKDDNYAGVDFNKVPVKKKLLERYKSSDAKNNSHLTFAYEIELTNNKELKGLFNIGNEKWKIIILLDKSNVETSTIIEKIDLEIKNKSITTFYNENASIWNKANNGNSTEFYSNVLFPVLIQLSIQYINLIVKELNPIDSLNNNYDTIENGEFID